MLNSNVSTFVPRVASFSIFNSTAPKKVKIKDGRVMGENFLLSLRLFCLLRRLTFVAVLRCVHGMFTLFHLCTASMRCNRVYFHFNSIGVRSPRWVIFGELMFRYICRHFLCFLFSRWYFFFYLFRLSFCFAFEQPSIRVCVIVLNTGLYFRWSALYLHISTDARYRIVATKWSMNFSLETRIKDLFNWWWEQQCFVLFLHTNRLFESSGKKKKTLSSFCVIN